MKLLIKSPTKPVRKAFKPVQQVRPRGNRYEWFVLDPVSHAVLDRGREDTRNAASTAASKARTKQTELFLRQ